ncbi:cysteine hydrolase family protein [Bacillus sp. MUM 13]|uniref:cysteine hydrolase family protein n=1 Tax=Bacillus sp. MUM 13 TaxID=1678001 RepID=UPI0008F55AA3|nr:cysteine hydrolase family protein [Bacillus sp. MUM 13]OIK11677.1 cysteine hydrolase [Bacillus sp. MUM 13]
MNTALLLIDIQNDYFPNGKFELHEPIQAASNAKEILERFREINAEIIHIQHIAKKADATFFLANTEGVSIHPLVSPLEGELIITKSTPNSFNGTDLHNVLQTKKVNHLVICGMMTHMCIDATVRAAKDLGYTITLIEDACATRDLDFNNKFVQSSHVQTAFVSALNGTYADIKNKENYLAK